MKLRSSTIVVVMALLMTMSSVFGVGPGFRDNSGTTAARHVWCDYNSVVDEDVASATETALENAGFFYVRFGNLPPSPDLQLKTCEWQSLAVGGRDWLLPVVTGCAGGQPGQVTLAASTKNSVSTPPKSFVPEAVPNVDRPMNAARRACLQIVHNFTNHALLSLPRNSRRSH